MSRALAHNLSGERTDDVRLKEIAPFSQWLLKSSVKKGLEEAGFRVPTVIQASAIPLGKSGIDLLVQSKAGTGKTLIFCTVLLEVCSDEPGLHSIIVTPTREIAIQIEEVLKQIAKFCKDYQVINTIGGTDVTVDRKRLQNARTVVGTPGRLVHLIQSDILKTTNIKLVVFDEADQLYSSSHRKNLEIILNSIPAKRQILACSATFCNDLDEELAKVMRNPLLISSKDQVTALLGIKQYIYELPEQKTSVLEMEAKVAAMVDIFRRVPFKLCMVFAGSQSRAESYSYYLKNSGWECELITGAQKQIRRSEIFKKFQNFQTRILVSTDLMARGVDSEHVNLVINVEPPRDMVTYLHRIGRAGRFGSHGIAITFVSSKNDNTLFQQILADIGCGMNVNEFPKTIKNGEDENFWNPASFKTELQQEKNAESEESCVAVLRDKENTLPLQNEKQKEDKEASNCDSNVSLDTKTFCIDSKDSAVNILPAIVENKENLLYLQAEATPTSNRSSIQLSANTIDDASSIAADSVFSSELDLHAPHPSLALDQPKNLNYSSFMNSELREAERVKVLRNDLFVDYCTNVLKDAGENIQSETEMETEVDSTEDSLQAEKEGTKIRAYYDDMFADYTNFMLADDKDHEEGSELVKTSDNVDETSNEKNISLEVNLSLPVIGERERVSNNIIQQEKHDEIVSDERLTDSQTYMQETICASNGSYSADSEPSMELLVRDKPERNQHSKSEFYFEEDLSTNDKRNTREAVSEDIENEYKETEQNESQEEFNENTNQNAENLTRIHDLWMKEYWRQVNFIEAYVKFALDYRKQCEDN